MIVWTDERDGATNLSIDAQKLDSDGTALWGSSDIRINQNVDSYIQEEADVAVDSNANAIVVWRDFRDKSGADENIYGQKLNPAGAPQWGSSDKKVNQINDDYDQLRPAIDVDSDDNVIVVWQDERDDGTNDDIYAQKLNSTGIAQWGVTDKLVNQDSTAVERTYTQIAIDSSGNSYITWTDERNGATNRSIYAQKLDSSGTYQWGSSDVRVNQDTTAAIDREYSSVHVDNDGCVIIAWDDEREVAGDSDDSYAQKLYCEDAGRAYIFYGKSSWSSSYSASAADVKIDGEYNGDQFGISVSLAGDVDNSNYNDTIVGAIGYNYDQGRAYVFYGDGSIPTSAGSADKTYTGENVGDMFGFSVSTAGDVDNDGKDDVIIGAPYNDDSGTNAGEAYIFFSGDQTVYVDSNTVTNGYMTNFNNAKSASDSGAYAVLKEVYVSGGSAEETLRPNGAGDKNTWDSGVYTDVNDQSDSTYLESNDQLGQGLYQVST
jgi:hypothetical protein